MESGAGRKVAEILSENGIDDNSESLILRRESRRAARKDIRQQPARHRGGAETSRAAFGDDPRAERTLLAFDASSRLQLLDTFAVSKTEATRRPLRLENAR